VLIFLIESRPVAAARRWFGGFGARLGLGVLIALGLAGVLTYVVVSAELEHNQLADAASLHDTDAAALLQAAAPYAARARWLAEATEQLRGFGKRRGALEAILVDRRFRVVAASDPVAVGGFDRSPRLRAAFRTRLSWAGHEQGKRRDHRDFEFEQPITIHGSSFVLEITTDGEVFDGQLTSIREKMLIVGGAAFLGAAILFWLTGGRRVLRIHRFALERAARDGLTDLPNHRAFQEALRDAQEAASRYGEKVALLLIDLDGFKAENDRHGHRYGDDRLIAAARALSSARSRDLPFRVGGDEFALLVTHADVDGARAVANRLHDRLAKAQIPASIGVGVLRTGQSPADLREEVDAALYEAKRTGGNRIILAEDILDRVSVMTADRREALARLIAADGIDVVFQPIWDLPSNRLLGVEALARPHADYGFAGPADAFDAAHQLGLVHALDRLCVDRALRRTSELPDGVLLFLNISPRTLDLDADGSHWFAEAATAHGVDPTCVVIEVTERMGSRTDRVIDSIRHLRARGFRIAIDDMGSGNSGLEMLRELEPEYVKLDRSVVVGALTDRHARGILMGVTAFAHETGASVIAEGIEDDEVLDFITTLRARAGDPQIIGGQGYRLGRPDSQLPTTQTPPPSTEHISASTTAAAGPPPAILR
jgi:diguanylate cyclase (GGDEF)-like protein